MRVHLSPVAVVLLPVLVVGFLATCGPDPLASTDPTHVDASALRRRIDLDALLNDPATQDAMAAASDPNSPCGKVLVEVKDLATTLAPAVASKDYGKVAQHLPEILAALRHLFACVQSQRGGNPAAPQPALPVVPTFEAGECVVVALDGEQTDSCAESDEAAPRMPPKSAAR